MHKNRGVKTRQLDDGIGDTLVLALEVVGNGRPRYHVTLTRSRHVRECCRFQPGRSSDRLPSREQDRGGEFGPCFTQTAPVWRGLPAEIPRPSDECAWRAG